MIRSAFWLALVVLAPLAEDDFTPLFNGKDLEGWTVVGGKADNWEVKDGVLATKGQGGWLSTEKEYSDFTLKLEFRVPPGGNSGIFLRSPHTGDPAYTGMEVQVLDDEAEKYKNLLPGQYCGSVYRVMPAERGHTKPAGEWNAMEITANGPHIVVKLNGATIVDDSIDKHQEDTKEHPGLKRDKGYIGLQSHGDPVEFRNIAIKTLK